MNNYFLLSRLLPSLIGLLIGLAASGITLAYYRGESFDVILVGTVLDILGFLAGSLLLATLFWVVGRAVIGPLGRQHFQTIWVVCAAFFQLVVAALSTYNLYQLGVFTGILSRPDIFPRSVVIVFPYLMTISSLAVLLNDESEEDRAIRLATLQAIDSEFRRERSRSRGTAFIPISICVAFGGVLGWFFPIEPDSNVFTTILFAAVGLPVGMAVHRYLPAQRRLRSLESDKKILQ